MAIIGNIPYFQTNPHPDFRLNLASALLKGTHILICDIVSKREQNPPASIIHIGPCHEPQAAGSQPGKEARNDPTKSTECTPRRSFRRGDSWTMPGMMRAGNPTKMSGGSRNTRKNKLHRGRNRIDTRKLDFLCGISFRAIPRQ